MLRQVKYFQAVVTCRSFTEAAALCNISQSAISQQIQALERELGVKLLIREKRKFALTPAGEFFYQRSLGLVKEFDKLCEETVQMGDGTQPKLVIGYLKNYFGDELSYAVASFRKAYPQITLETFSGTHEELYEALRTGRADLVLNDLRRAPSDRYENYWLSKTYLHAALGASLPLAKAIGVTMEDLKDLPCILITPPSQEENERLFYQEYLQVKSDFCRVDTLDEAVLKVISGQGYLLREWTSSTGPAKELVKCVPVLDDGKIFTRDYYAFWQLPPGKKYVPVFGEELKKQFSGQK